MIVKRITALEQYVRAYISKLRLAGNLRAEAPYIRKAISMIQFALGTACCDDIDTVISHGRRDNVLTNAVRGLLLLNPLRRNSRKSYLKTIQLLQHLLYDPCCYGELALTVNDAFECLGADAVVSLIGLDGQGTFSFEIPTIESTISLPLIGRYTLSVTAPNTSADASVSVLGAEDEVLGVVNLTTEVLAGSFDIESLIGGVSIVAECAAEPDVEIEITLTDNVGQYPYSFFLTFYDNETSDVLGVTDTITQAADGPVGTTITLPVRDEYSVCLTADADNIFNGPMNILNSVDALVGEFPNTPGVEGCTLSAVPYSPSYSLIRVA